MQVVVAGDGVEHAAHAAGLVVPGHTLVAEVGVVGGDMLMSGRILDQGNCGALATVYG